MLRVSGQNANSLISNQVVHIVTTASLVAAANGESGYGTAGREVPTAPSVNNSDAV
jgi:hypothetical protein